MARNCDIVRDDALYIIFNFSNAGIHAHWRQATLDSDTYRPPNLYCLVHNGTGRGAGGGDDRFIDHTVAWFEVGPILSISLSGAIGPRRQTLELLNVFNSSY